MRLNKLFWILGAVVCCILSSKSYAASYEDYFTALGKRESGNNYSAENSLGYIGRYQFGEPGLMDCQFYTDDNTKKNDWKGPWKEDSRNQGVVSKQKFFEKKDFQDFAIKRFNELNWATIVRLDLTKFIGKNIGGVVITRSGMLGGAHLLGPGNLKKFLTSNGNKVPVDGNGTKITEYIKLFGNFDVPFH